jgi:hypothetical protein
MGIDLYGDKTGSFWPGDDQSTSGEGLKTGDSGK